MKKVYNTCLFYKCIITKVNKSFFLRLLDSNTTNIVKDIFIIQTEDMQNL